MYKEALFGVRPLDIQIAHSPEGLLRIPTSKRLEVMYQEMEELGHGYLRRRLSELGRASYKDPKMYDEGVVDTFDSLPFHLQAEPIPNQRVDRAIDILLKKVVETPSGIEFDIGWFRNKLDPELLRGRQEIADDLPPVLASAYMLGSDALAFTIGLTQLAKQSTRLNARQGILLQSRAR